MASGGHIKMQGHMYSFVAILFAFASLMPMIGANIADPQDGYWRRRAAEAWNRTLESYEPYPEKIINHLNTHVHRTLKEIKETGISLNSTRRQLAKGYVGPCFTTNPIDRCWRCKSDWAENRFRLADCAFGFGHKATGGKGGRIYVVTDKSDDDLLNPKPGTLRHAVIQKEPLWIIFKKDMVIKLKEELIMQGDKTIDARGAKVHIAGGASIMIQFVRNVIIHGLRIHDIKKKHGGLIRDSVDHFGLRTESDGDGISIFGAQDIWIDHVSMTNCADGLIDAIQGSTGITISNSHFTDHNKVMLFGGRDEFTEDEKMQVTLAFNHFGKRLVQRMPRCRYGYIHVVNNDYTHWNMYAIGGSMHPTIISQGNRYIASSTQQYAQQVTKREKAPKSEWMQWTWRSEGDTFRRGAYFVESGDPDWSKKHPDVCDKINPAPAEHVDVLTKFSGSLGCKVGLPC